MSKDWNLEIHHSHREATNLDDLLAKRAHETETSEEILREPPA